MAEAREADVALARGESLGAFHGVPITIKDSHDTEGIVSTGGTLGRKDFVPDADATAVARMRAAGAIVLGKTNTPELHALVRDRQPGLWTDQQPIRREPNSGWQQRRSGSDHRSRRLSDGSRHRHRRQHTSAVSLLRSCGSQAHVGPRPPHGTHRPVGTWWHGLAHDNRPYGPLRRRPVAWVLHHRWP